MNVASRSVQADGCRSLSQRVLKGLLMQLQELNSDGDFTGCNSEDSSSHDGGLKLALSRNGVLPTPLALIKPHRLTFLRG